MSLENSGFEAVIGLEVHCQLATQTKIFCSCPCKVPKGLDEHKSSNLNTCPVCSAQPGALPVLNKKAVEFAIRAGLATHCEIRLHSEFSRKNYFYPDLPKGYQISQFDRPLCEKGWFEFELKTGTKRVQIQRIHLEEDAGKTLHREGFSIVNLNRAGVPLIEIVSAPDFTSPAEAGAYLRALQSLVIHLEISDGNLQEGNFRCDANVSVRPRGTEKLGTRVELKNINSFKFIEKAIDYEIHRQIDLIESRGSVIQETRGYNAAENRTFSMRSKEESQDYRYFPEPDLLPLRIDPAWIKAIESSMPELPGQRKARYIQKLELSQQDASLLVSSKPLAEYFEQVVGHLGHTLGHDAAKLAANWVNGELARLLKETGLSIQECRMSPENLAEVIQLVQAQVISNTGAKEVVSLAWETGEPILSIVERKGLRQVSDLASIEPILDKVIASFPKQLAEFRSGKEKILGFFVGQVMKETGGTVNPTLLGDFVRKKLQG